MCPEPRLSTKYSQSHTGRLSKQRLIDLGLFSEQKQNTKREKTVVKTDTASTTQGKQFILINNL